MTLRRAAEQALAAIKSANQVNYSWACVEAVAVLEAALAEPEQEPLTEEEIEVLAMDIDGTPKIYFEFARDIKWAHGIKGEA